MDHVDLGRRFSSYSFFVFPSAHAVTNISIHSTRRPTGHYSLNKKEWIQKKLCSLFKEWILENSEIKVNLEWTLILCYSLILEWPQGSLRDSEWSLRSLQIHSKFTLISLFSKMHSLKSEHIHSFLFREYPNTLWQWRIQAGSNRRPPPPSKFDRLCFSPFFSSLELEFFKIMLR